MGRRGMRDVVLGRRPVQKPPQSREQAASELARLEHERVRLDRELSFWRANLRRTEDRIAQIDERLGLLHQSLGLRAVEPPGADGPAQDDPQWETISLDY